MISSLRESGANRQVASPFGSTSAAPEGPSESVTISDGGEAPATAHRSLFSRMAAPAMAGMALVVGASVMAPGTASAHEWRGGYGYSQNWHRHEGGGNVGGAILGGIAGAIIGNAIINGGGPVYVAPPVYVNPGYNNYGCDGVVHHFDGRGNVADASGYYHLGYNGWGQCVATPAW